MRLTYLLLSPTFGMHQYTADLADRMVAEHDVHLVTTESYPADRYGPDISVHTPVRLGNTGLSLESLQLGGLGQIKETLRRIKPELVHITGPHMWNVELVRWLRRQSVPVVHTIHDLDPHHGVSYGRLLHLWNWAIIRSADHLVVHADVYRRRLIANGVPPERVTCTLLTHLFLSHSAWRQVEQEEVAVSYEPMVLFFGRVEAYKGVDVLLNSFDRLGRSLRKSGTGQSVRLVLAGPGNGNLLRNADRVPGVEWRNRLIGDEEGLDLFKRCSVVVLPYRDATQSALVAAAYYFRKPVIVTAVGALAEYVEADRTGIVIDGEDTETALAAALGRIVLEPGLKENLGGVARAWYDEHRSRESQVMERLYNSRLKKQELLEVSRPGENSA